jgi:Putative Actinobacterial Holin-X, holin superfamily III
LPELVGRLINDVSDLADRQVELAREEMGEAKDEAIDAVKRIAIGAGIALTAGLLLLIWAWTAFIWFFNWLFGFISFPTPFGTQSLAWVGWLLGLLVPAVGAWIAYRRFIRRGISQAMSIWPPLPRTRETLKENLEWVKNLRTPSAR